MAAESTGRNQLKGVLDDLVSQVKEEKDVDVEEIDEEVEEAARDLMEYSSPRKRPYKQRRKRKRAQRNSVNDGFYSDEDDPSSSDVLTIHGRHINLTQLGPRPSLYSVCRAWILGQHLNQDKVSSDIPVSEGIYSLPPPSDVSPMESPPHHTHVTIETMDSTLFDGLTNEELLSTKQSYIKKWKAVRSRCKSNALREQQRFASSQKMLQNLYKRPS